jgi:hypothetical protein
MDIEREIQDTIVSIDQKKKNKRAFISEGKSTDEIIENIST